MSARKNRHRIRKTLRERDGDLCCWCHEPMLFRKDQLRETRPDDQATIEHIIPSSLGGTWNLDNLALAHWGCNRRRVGSARPPLPANDAGAFTATDDAIRLVTAEMRGEGL